MDFGNKWYSAQRFCLEADIQMGVSGTKDYIEEKSLFSYQFKSLNRHCFFIRLHHNGMATGCFTGYCKRFDWSVMLGFEYLVKIFSQDSGFFLLTDIGGGNNGFCMYAAVGVGSHNHTNIFLDFTYMLNRVILSQLKFTVEILRFFSISGMIGIDSTFFDNQMPDFFCFKAGANLGFSARPVFTATLGGGVTLNDYYAVGGFGTISLKWNW